MLHLYLIRHADAVPRTDPTYADDDRPLTELGKSQSRELGEALTEHGVRFDVILCSRLPRAQQTVEALLATLPEPKPPVVYTDELLPGFKPRKLDRELSRQAGEAIALVGHEPDLSRYTARLIGSKKACMDLAKAGVACVACSEAPGKGCGSLVWLAPPALFGAGD
jgi:phosphohistidine phosphatase